MNVRRLVLAASLGMISMHSALAANASDTLTIPVGATITSVCVFERITNTTIDFTLDQTTSANIDASILTQPQFWCTKDSAITISDDTGQNIDTGSPTKPYRMKRTAQIGGVDVYINYNLTYLSAHTGAGKSNPITMNLAAKVVNADFIDKPAGTYTDAVTLSIFP